MSGVRRVSWRWAFVAIASVAACRSHQQVCDEATCGNLGGAGRGADATEPEPEAMAGAAGGAPEPECRRDQDCANDLRCDGSEHCSSGKCEAGAALECDHGTGCVEGAEARCLYEQPSQWMLVSSLDTLFGIRIADIGNDPKLIALAERPRKATLTGFDEVFWAPNGLAALVRSAEQEFGFRLELLRFGAGLPSQLLPLPDVPNWGDFYRPPAIAWDSTRALVTDGYSGTFQVDLSESGAPTQLIAPRAAIDYCQFCRDSRSWLQTPPDDTPSLATLVDGEILLRELAGGTEVSADGRVLSTYLRDDDENLLGTRLSACSGEAWEVEFLEGSSVFLSPDSKLAVVSPAAGGSRLVSLEDPANPIEIWSHPDASPSNSPTFVADGQKLLVSATGDDDVRSLHVVDFAQAAAQPVSLRLPGDAVIDLVTDSWLLAWAAGADDSRQLLWQSLAPTERPVTVLSDATDDDIVLHALGTDAVLLQRELDETTELSILHLEAGFVTVEPVTSFSGTVSEIEPARDGSGFAVIVRGTFIDSKAYWIPLTESGAGEPLLLSERAYNVSLQPWP